MTMRVILNESQLKKVLYEMAYPSNFNFDEFKSLKSFNKRVEYCNSRLIRIGSGSSRVAYKVDEDKVLKLAKNEKGIAQNELEVNIFNDSYAPSIIAKVLEYDENFLWVEMELANKLKASDIKDVFKNITYNEFFYIITYIGAYIKGRNTFKLSEILSNKMYDGGYNEEFFNEVHDYISNFSNIHDIERPSSWGTLIRDGHKEIVLVDYGANDEIIKKYYNR